MSNDVDSPKGKATQLLNAAKEHRIVAWFGSFMILYELVAFMVDGVSVVKWISNNASRIIELSNKPGTDLLTAVLALCILVWLGLKSIDSKKAIAEETVSAREKDFEQKIEPLKTILKAQGRYIVASERVRRALYAQHRLRIRRKNIDTVYAKSRSAKEVSTSSNRLLTEALGDKNVVDQMFEFLGSDGDKFMFEFKNAQIGGNEEQNLILDFIPADQMRNQVSKHKSDLILCDIALRKMSLIWEKDMREAAEILGYEWQIAPVERP